jgi:uncharacterized protein
VRTRAAFALVLLALFAAPATLAKDAFPSFTAPVVDAAGVVPKDVEQRVDAALVEYNQRSSIQIAVAVIRTTGGRAIEDYSIDLARAWGVGQKGKNKGVLLLIAYDDHHLRIEVGSGLEGDLTDLESGRIIREIMTPRLRAGDVGGAIEAGVNGIEQAIGGELAPVVTPESRSRSSPGAGVFGFLPILFFIFLLTSVVGRRSRRSRHWWMVPILLGGGWGPRGGGGLGGGFGGGGGFSGGGGGGFSGGGASGSW